MRAQLELPPLSSFPSDPTELTDEAVAFLHSGEEQRGRSLAIGTAEELRVEHAGRAFHELEAFIAEKNDWVFLSLSYDLKEELESLPTLAPRRTSFPVLHAFRPRVLFHLEDKRTLAEYLPAHCDENEAREFHRVLSQDPDPGTSESQDPIELLPRTDRTEYLRAVHALQEHIQQGDIYEVNHCQEFYAEAPIDPYRSFTDLQRIANAPMAAYYRLDNAHLICASPERFLRICDRKVLAQPIKGTAPRGKDAKEDHELAEKLRRDPKERAENIMIVDLVRNDLSQTAAKASVEMEELCGVYSFPTVHQMISSIRSTIAPELSAVDVVRKAFPMGSMTGAPKVRAMELIEMWEGMQRGLYSGSVGYVDPHGNWDLNVVIRSLLYDAKRPYISAMVGGAITARSDPEQEYEECLLKANALKKILG